MTGFTEAIGHFYQMRGSENVVEISLFAQLHEVIVWVISLGLHNIGRIYS
ncbi:hypothetical protein J42TS3_51050 [Paenibacillus vini]|uniref:Uncharacterized protein n=1 Tax=Paenibacillus vini TaxID=1476024 RepID=A0ABQ4MJA8_9BACL|nr:hypothetical protein J42TS3_51050 [Paenibacillus vini]